MSTSTFEAVSKLFPEAISTPLASLVPSRVPDRQTLSAIPISRCPNDVIHLVLVRLDRDDVPSL